ncbi:OPT superfamily oligopeptide transporter [Sesbania bispinosa]|nr:OPT superfamily oligopeptide transporter [Sesbania bispinosa]
MRRSEERRSRSRSRRSEGREQIQSRHEREEKPMRNADAGVETKRHTYSNQKKIIVNQFGISQVRPYTSSFTPRLLNTRIPERFQKMTLSIPPYTWEVDP